MFGDSLADKPGTFWILSFLPSLLPAPQSDQGWHLKNYNCAALADKRNTGKYKQKPLLFGRACGTFHTDATEESENLQEKKKACKQLKILFNSQS